MFPVQVRITSLWTWDAGQYGEVKGHFVWVLANTNGDLDSWWHGEDVEVVLL